METPQSHQNTRPSLLALPFEIQDQIFGYVLGNQLIKIELLVNGPISPIPLRVRSIQSRVADSDSLNSLAVNDSRSSLQYVPYEAISLPIRNDVRQDVEVLEFGDKQIHEQIWNLEGLEPPISWEEVKLNLGLLGVCRQTYTHTSALLWSSSTFSFDNPESFDVFISRIPSQAFKQITNIHLRMRPFIGDCHSWIVTLWKTLPQPLSLAQKTIERIAHRRRLNRLTKLKNVHITVHCHERYLNWSVVGGFWLRLMLLMRNSCRFPIPITIGRKQTDAEVVVGGQGLTFIEDARKQIHEDYIIPSEDVSRAQHNAFRRIVNYDDQARDAYEPKWGAWYYTVRVLKSIEDERRLGKGENILDISDPTMFGPVEERTRARLRAKGKGKKFLLRARRMLRAILRI